MLSCSGTTRCHSLLHVVQHPARRTIGEDDVPVLPISRSIIVLSRLMRDDRVSNKLSKTAFIAPTSFGGQISHIASANAI